MFSIRKNINRYAAVFLPSALGLQSIYLLSNKMFIVGTELAETPFFLLCLRGSELLVFDGPLLGC